MQVKCTSCGAIQKISEAINCDFCGNLIKLESATNNYKTALTGESGNLMAMAETAIEATNWGEALQFFNQVLTKDISNSDAWLGKGIAIVYTSKIGDLKITESIAYWKNALKHAVNQEATGKRVAKEINEVVNKFYPSLENHFIKFKDLDNSYGELVDKFVVLEKAIDYATQLDSNIKYYETGFSLCSRVIQIPKQYALADEGAAWVQGIIGTVQGIVETDQRSKYKTQVALQAGQKAVARKQEINRAALIINQLEGKYQAAIKNIDPNYRPKVHNPTKVDNNGPTNKLIISTFNDLIKSKSSYWARMQITGEIKTNLGLKQAEASKLVNKVLIDNNLLDADEVKKQDRNAIIFIVAIFSILYIIFLLKT